MVAKFIILKFAYSSFAYSSFDSDFADINVKIHRMFRRAAMQHTLFANLELALQPFFYHVLDPLP